MIEGTMDATVVIHNRRIRGSRFKSSDLVIREKANFSDSNSVVISAINMVEDDIRKCGILFAITSFDHLATTVNSE